MAYGDDFNDWVLEAVVQDGMNTKPEFILANDGMVQSYADVEGIDWEKIWQAASERRGSIPPKDGAYWYQGAPISSLAFWTDAARMRMVMEPKVPVELLHLIAKDHNPEIRTAAFVALGVPESEREFPERVVTEERARLASPDLDDDLFGSYTGRSKGLFGAALGWLIPIIIILGVFVYVGISNAKEFSNEREMRVESAEFVFDIEEREKPLCKGGDDYYACVNMHIQMHNSICVGNYLTENAKSTCQQLKKFNETGKKRLKNCTYGCKTDAGKNERWGWTNLTLVPVIEQPFGNRPYMDDCHFLFPPLSVGNCVASIEALRPR